MDERNTNGDVVRECLKSDAFLFDIDGTLLNTRDLVHWNALHQAMLEAYGIDTTIEGIAYHGKTDLGILRAALDRAGIRDGQFEANLPTALHVICRDVSKRESQLVTEVCPGIKDLLQFLAEQRKFIGVASGNLESVGWCKIRAAGLQSLFQFGCFSDQCEDRASIFRNAVEHVRSRLGRQSTVCFIGDTPSDIAAAREVGGRIIAAATGIFSRQQLASHQPDLCISRCDELLRP